MNLDQHFLFYQTILAGNNTDRNEVPPIFVSSVTKERMNNDKKSIITMTTKMTIKYVITWLY